MAAPYVICSMYLETRVSMRTTECAADKFHISHYTSYLAESVMQQSDVRPSVC